MLGQAHRCLVHVPSGPQRHGPQRDWAEILEAAFLHTAAADASPRREGRGGWDEGLAALTRPSHWPPRAGRLARWCRTPGRPSEAGRGAGTRPGPRAGWRLAIGRSEWRDALGLEGPSGAGRRSRPRRRRRSRRAFPQPCKAVRAAPTWPQACCASSPSTRSTTGSPSARP